MTPELAALNLMIFAVGSMTLMELVEFTLPLPVTEKGATRVEPLFTSHSMNVNPSSRGFDDNIFNTTPV
ncbi:hypothetical protein NY2A_b171L [Paramecium bursaria Chlorella virus NY2A]|uniref:Uncharacterized protein b171L n=1 Tax=Paramecium bursaria Chlorella virus NY2A TaxID=46021 RepID=A7IW46_PBCVN|nr:hypothetical protein NY2A_b171L [Paramecium bursaria Chlorella virus NY2A]ABT14570.1 hypothetical protein NY2A_b171L [Paramecium bursaria Chlorella virus NY2A]